VQLLSTRRVAGGVLVLALLVTAAAVAAAMTGRGAGHGTVAQPYGSAQPAGLGTIDPRFVLKPHTMTQEARVGTHRLALTIGPLIPGVNHLTITVTDEGRTVPGAQVRLVATMPGMSMVPRSYSAREVRANTGRYTGSADLPMFGGWQLAVHVDGRGELPVVHTFHVDISFPLAFLSAVATHGAAQ
jgi:hypothetical protein